MDELLWEMCDTYDGDDAPIGVSKDLDPFAKKEAGRRVQRELRERRFFEKRHPGIEIRDGNQKRVQEKEVEEGMKEHKQEEENSEKQEKQEKEEKEEKKEKSEKEEEENGDEDGVGQGELCWKCNHPCYFSCFASKEGLVSCLAHVAEALGEGVEGEHVRWVSTETLSEWLDDNDMSSIEPLKPPKMKKSKPKQATNKVTSPRETSKESSLQDSFKEAKLQKDILEKWWSKHKKKILTTQVSRDDKQKLATQAGKTVQQIESWIAHRRKQLKKDKKKPGPKPKAKSVPV